MKLFISFIASQNLQKELLAKGLDASLEQTVEIDITEQDVAFKKAKVNKAGELHLDLSKRDMIQRITDKGNVGQFKGHYYIVPLKKDAGYIVEERGRTINIGDGFNIVCTSSSYAQIDIVPDSIDKLNSLIAVELTEEQKAHNAALLKKGLAEAQESFKKEIKEKDSWFATEEEAEKEAEAKNNALAEEEEKKRILLTSVKKEQSEFIKNHGSELLKARIQNEYSYLSLLAEEVSMYIFKEVLGLIKTDTDTWYRGEDGEVWKEPSTLAMAMGNDLNTKLEKVLSDMFPSMLRPDSSLYLSVLDAGDSNDTIYKHGIEFSCSLTLSDGEDAEHLDYEVLSHFHEIDEEVL